MLLLIPYSKTLIAYFEMTTIVMSSCSPSDLNTRLFHSLRKPIGRDTFQTYLSKECPYSCRVVACCNDWRWLRLTSPNYQISKKLKPTLTQLNLTLPWFLELRSQCPNCGASPPGPPNQGLQSCVLFGD